MFKNKKFVFTGVLLSIFGTACFSHATLPEPAQLARAGGEVTERSPCGSPTMAIIKLALSLVGKYNPDASDEECVDLFWNDRCLGQCINISHQGGVEYNAGLNKIILDLLKNEKEETRGGNVVLYHSLSGEFLFVYKYFASLFSKIGEGQNVEFQLRGNKLPFVNPKTQELFSSIGEVREYCGISDEGEAQDYLNGVEAFILHTNLALSSGLYTSASDISSVGLFCNNGSVNRGDIINTTEGLISDELILRGLPASEAKQCAKEAMGLFQKYYIDGIGETSNNGLLAISVPFNRADEVALNARGGGAIQNGTPSVKKVLANLQIQFGEVERYKRVEARYENLIRSNTRLPDVLRKIINLKLCDLKTMLPSISVAYLEELTNKDIFENACNRWCSKKKKEIYNEVMEKKYKDAQNRDAYFAYKDYEKAYDKWVDEGCFGDDDNLSAVLNARKKYEEYFGHSEDAGNEPEIGEDDDQNLCYISNVDIPTYDSDPESLEFSGEEPNGDNVDEHSEEESDGGNVGGSPEEESDGDNVGGSPEEESDGGNVGGSPEEESDGGNVDGSPAEESDGGNVGGSFEEESDDDYVDKAISYEKRYRNNCANSSRVRELGGIFADYNDYEEVEEDGDKLDRLFDEYGVATKAKEINEDCGCAKENYEVCKEIFDALIMASQCRIPRNFDAKRNELHEENIDKYEKEVKSSNKELKKLTGEVQLYLHPSIDFKMKGVFRHSLNDEDQRRFQDEFNNLIERHGTSVNNSVDPFIIRGEYNSEAQTFSAEALPVLIRQRSIFYLEKIVNEGKVKLTENNKKEVQKNCLIALFEISANKDFLKYVDLMKKVFGDQLFEVIPEVIDEISEELDPEGEKKIKQQLDNLYSLAFNGKTGEYNAEIVLVLMRRLGLMKKDKDSTHTENVAKFEINKLIKDFFNSVKSNEKLKEVMKRKEIRDAYQKIAGEGSRSRILEENLEAIKLTLAEITE